MFKLKLTIWIRPPHNSSVFGRQLIGTAFDHKSFAAVEAAIRAGCFGPASKLCYWTEYVDPSYGLTESRFFEKKGGRLKAVLPFVVSENWVKFAQLQSSVERQVNKNSSKRRFLATEWQLLPYQWLPLAIEE